MESVTRLVNARTHIWRIGGIPVELQPVWRKARRLIPDWPGFERLTLNAEEREALGDCAAKLDEFTDAVARMSAGMTVRPKPGGLVEVHVDLAGPTPRQGHP